MAGWELPLMWACKWGKLTQTEGYIDGTWYINGNLPHLPHLNGKLPCLITTGFLWGPYMATLRITLETRQGS